MHCVVVVRCSCFLMEREPKQREVWLFHEVGLILLLCGRVGIVRYTLSCFHTLSCFRALLHSLAVSFALLPSCFLSSVTLHSPILFLSFPSCFVSMLNASLLSQNSYVLDTLHCYYGMFWKHVSLPNMWLLLWMRSKTDLSNQSKYEHIFKKYKGWTSTS